VKCPPKNTGLCLAKYSKISLSHHTKGAQILKDILGYGYPWIWTEGGEELQGGRDWKNTQ